MTNKIILFGSNGMLGTYIKTYFSNKNIELICITRNEFEVTSYNISKLEDYLIKYNIDKNTCIINCIGLIQQCINDRDINDYYISIIFPNFLTKICNKYNPNIICSTTDYIFNGKKGNYNEIDFHDEINIYSISKLIGEPTNATVIRTSIIGEEIDNKNSFLEFVKNTNNEIHGWNNNYWIGI